MLLLFFAMSSPAAPWPAARGRVTLAGDALPGATVTLAGRTTITDIEGRYTFESVEPGQRVLKAELATVGSIEKVIEVKDGENQLADVALPWETSQEITLDCRSCGENAPETEWDNPTCAEYDFDESLIASAKEGDRSAIELLETRYRHAMTYTERFLIAEGLLGRSKDDREIWREIEKHAEIAVRFSDVSDDSREKFAAFCAEHGYPADEYDAVAWHAFSVAMTDKRSRPLLLLALEGGDEPTVYGAILGLAMQKDESALPAIEKAMRRFEYPEQLAPALDEFASPAAVALAKKFVGEEESAEDR